MTKEIRALYVFWMCPLPGFRRNAKEINMATLWALRRIPPWFTDVFFCIGVSCREWPGAWHDPMVRMALDAIRLRRKTLSLWQELWVSLDRVAKRETGFIASPEDPFGPAYCLYAATHLRGAADTLGVQKTGFNGEPYGNPTRSVHRGIVKPYYGRGDPRNGILTADVFKNIRYACPVGIVDWIAPYRSTTGMGYPNAFAEIGKIGVSETTYKMKDVDEFPSYRLPMIGQSVSLDGALGSFAIEECMAFDMTKVRERHEETIGRMIYIPWSSPETISSRRWYPPRRKRRRVVSYRRARARRRR